MEPRDERIDTLFNEAQIVLWFWNMQIEISKKRSGNWGIQGTQEELSQLIGIGARTFERSTKRLVEMNRLGRINGTGKAPYAYYVTHEMVCSMANDIMLNAGILIIEHEDGKLTFMLAMDYLNAVMNANEEQSNNE